MKISFEIIVLYPVVIQKDTQRNDRLIYQLYRNADDGSGKMNCAVCWHNESIEAPINLVRHIRNAPYSINSGQTNDASS